MRIAVSPFHLKFRSPLSAFLSLKITVMASNNWNLKINCWINLKSWKLVKKWVLTAHYMLRYVDNMDWIHFYIQAIKLWWWMMADTSTQNSCCQIDEKSRRPVLFCILYIPFALLAWSYLPFAIHKWRWRLVWRLPLCANVQTQIILPFAIPCLYHGYRLCNASFNLQKGVMFDWRGFDWTLCNLCSSAEYMLGLSFHSTPCVDKKWKITYTTCFAALFEMNINYVSVDIVWHVWRPFENDLFQLHMRTCQMNCNEPIAIFVLDKQKPFLAPRPMPWQRSHVKSVQPFVLMQRLLYSDLHKLECTRNELASNVSQGLTKGIAQVKPLLI